MTSVTELEPYVDSSVDVLTCRIRELGSNETPMNMAEWFQWYAFDVIGELTFSKRYGFMDSAKDIGDSTKIIDKFQAYVSFVGQAFSYHWILLGNPLLSLFLKPPSGIIGEVYRRLFTSAASTDCLHRWPFEKSVLDKGGLLIDVICCHAS